MGKKDNDREINEWYNEVKLGRQIRICKMQEVQVNMDDKSTSIIPRDKVHILVTEEDKTGEDILAMSDFFGGYVQQLIDAIRTNAVTTYVPSLPVADIGIIGEVVQRAEVISQGATQLLPDFDSLPNGIRQKLKDGIYKVGESKQVDGNLRAVIVDEAGTRVKDVTLKEVNINLGTLEASRSITNQLQMRQIYAKVDAIQEMQSFQIARDRDRDIKVPFLDARYYILKAQGENCTDKEREEYLKKAADKLLSAVNSVYTDLTTSTEHMLKLTRFPIFQRKDQIRGYIGFLTEDIQVATKFVGLRMQVLDYLGDTDGAQIEMSRYQRVMTDFFTKALPNRGYSAAALIHLNYPYNAVNRDCWYQLSEDLKSALEAKQDKEKEHIYLVSVEEDEDGGE